MKPPNCVQHVSYTTVQTFKKIRYPEMQIPLLHTVRQTTRRIISWSFFRDLKTNLYWFEYWPHHFVHKPNGSLKSQNTVNYLLTIHRFVLAMWTVSTFCSQIAWTLLVALGVKVVWWSWENRKVFSLSRRFKFGHGALPLIGHIIFNGFSNVGKCDPLFYLSPFPTTLTFHWRRVVKPTLAHFVGQSKGFFDIVGDPTPNRSVRG